MKSNKRRRLRQKKRLKTTPSLVLSIFLKSCMTMMMMQEKDVLFIALVKMTVSLVMTLIVKGKWLFIALVKMTVPPYMMLQNP